LIAPTNRPLFALGGVDRDRQLTAYSAKATFQPVSAQRFDFSFFGDPATGDLGPQRRTSLLREDATGFSSLEYGGHNQTARYEGVVSSNFLVTASIARSRNYINETPETNTYSVLDTTVSPNVRSGGLGYVENIDGHNMQTRPRRRGCCRTTRSAADSSSRTSITTTSSTAPARPSRCRTARRRRPAPRSPSIPIRPSVRSIASPART
jgi:hypothetical protein